MTTNNAFNPREHLMTIKNRQGASDYLPVQWRLVWFREQCPQGAITTELVHMDLDKEVESEVMQWDNETRKMKSITKHGYGVAVFKATITDGQGGSSTGFGSEKASDFGDFLEKAETKSIGRALAALGYGTQFAPELNEESRIVDAPVDNRQAVQATSLVNAPLPSALRKLSDQVMGKGKFDAVKMKVLNANVPDDNLTPEQCSQIKQSLDTVVQRRAAEQKAS